jgi:hypothetical protein
VVLNGEDVELGAESGDEASEMGVALELFGGGVEVGGGVLPADVGPVCSVVDGIVPESEGVGVASMLEAVTEGPLSDTI